MTESPKGGFDEKAMTTEGIKRFPQRNSFYKTVSIPNIEKRDIFYQGCRWQFEQMKSQLEGKDKEIQALREENEKYLEAFRCLEAIDNTLKESPCVSIYAGQGVHRAIKQVLSQGVKSE